MGGEKTAGVLLTRHIMNKILVPIQNFSSLSLSASYFAIKFAKRSPTKILFLFFSNVSSAEAPSSMNKEEEAWRRQFDGLIQQARAEKINLEFFFSNEEYLEAVSQFARDHNTTEIIIALPQAQEPTYDKLIQDVNVLRTQVENQIVVVRPKEGPNGEDWQEPASGKLYPFRSRAFPEKKGS